jgi:hypothetical protein
MVWQNAKFCLRNLFRLSRYTDAGLLQTLVTHLGVVWFVVAIWRRQTLVFILGGLVIGVGGFAYDQIVQTPSDNVHLATLALTWGGFGTSVVLTLWQVLNLHRSRAFGDDQTQLHTLSRRFFMEPPPDGSTPDHLILRDIVSTDPDLPIVSVGRPDRPVNRALVDLRVAGALLNNQTIRLETAPDGSLFHGDRHDILAKSAQTMKSDQIDALQIMRREAIQSRTSFFDSPKIALKALQLGPDGTLQAKVGRSSYFVSCLTNDLSTQCLAFPDGTLIKSDPITALFPAVSLGVGAHAPAGLPAGQHWPPHPYELRPLDECQRLSNHVGSVVLAISKDGMPVLCFQGQGARINSGKVVLSGAGSIDLDDLHHAQAGDDLGLAIRYGMARELLEETGAIPQESSRACDRERLLAYVPRIRLAGYYRDLRRGGLPIFVGFCRMEADFDTIKSRQHDRPCLLQSPAETRVVSKLLETRISDAAGMLDYLDNRICGTATFRCDPSDQLMLICEMLRLPVMQQHFNEAIHITG